MLARRKDGVVDSNSRVYEVEGLNIVDASVIPLVSTANPQATVYAFVENTADLIKRVNCGYLLIQLTPIQDGFMVNYV